MPGSTPDLVIPFAVLADPLVDWPPLSQSMAERIEALIKGVESVVVVDPLGGLAGDGTTADQLRLRTAMAWGASLAAKPDLDSYGADSTVGQPVYLDSAGDIRTQPLVIPGGSGFTAATLPGTYPVGMSLLSVPTSTPNPDGWPISGNGAVHTLRRWGDTADNTTSVWQWCMRATGATANVQVFFRSGSNTTWSGWMNVAQDTGWVIGGSGSSVFVPRATQFTLLNSWARLRNGQVNFMLTGTMKVATAVPTASGDIPNTELGTMATKFISSAPSDQMIGPGASGRPLGGVMQTVSGKVYICSVGGTSAIAVGETISVGGSYLID